MHIHLYWEFVFLRTLKTGKQLCHLLERVTKRAWETWELNRLSQNHWDPEDKVGGKGTISLLNFRVFARVCFIGCNIVAKL